LKNEEEGRRMEEKKRGVSKRLRDEENQGEAR
jgi:hypothetical protein